MGRVWIPTQLLFQKTLKTGNQVRTQESCGKAQQPKTQGVVESLSLLENDASISQNAAWTTIMALISLKTRPVATENASRRGRSQGIDRQGKFRDVGPRRKAYWDISGLVGKRCADRARCCMDKRGVNLAQDTTRANRQRIDTWALETGADAASGKMLHGGAGRPDPTGNSSTHESHERSRGNGRKRTRATIHATRKLRKHSNRDRVANQAARRTATTANVTQPVAMRERKACTMQAMVQREGTTNT